MYTLLIGSTRAVMYVCCRDGKRKVHSGPNKTGKKRTCGTSRKIEKFCIARMSVTEHLESGKVVVRYISSHTNHESDLTQCKHLPLPLSVKKEIQQQFAAGVSLERIIDSKS